MIIYFILVIILFLYEYNILEMIKYFGYCQWKSKSASYDISRINLCRKYMKLIKALDIYYFLAFGSELGAVRNEGLIRQDKDIDIIVPISKNPLIFGCYEELIIKNKFYTNKSVLLDYNIKLCKKDRSYYSKILYNYVINRCKEYKFIKTRYTSEIIAFYISESLYLDIYITTANEWVYRNYNLCRCKFCNIYALCNDNSYKYSKLLYGNSFLVELRKKSHLRTIHINKTQM